MNLPLRERQGYLGKLADKTLPELQELLERQEKIMRRRHFMEHLPDKGEKTRRFAEHLKDLIENVKKLDESINVSSICSSASSNAHCFIDCQPLTIPGQKTFEVKSKEIVTLSELNEDDIASRLRNVQLGEPLSTTVKESSHQNSYERVIKKVEKTQSISKAKFLPNRTLKAGTVSVQSSLSRKVTEPQLVVESAAQPPVYEFQEAKLISVEESVLLINEQRIRNEELMAEQAAQRLASQLAPKMTSYTPKTVDLGYREMVKDSESEEDAIDSDDLEEDEIDDDPN